MVDIAHRVINENIIQPTGSEQVIPPVENIEKPEELPPLHPLAPASETFSIAPQETNVPEATSIVAPTKTPIDKTNTSVSTIALEESADKKTEEADNKEGEFIERVTAIHKG